MNILLRIVIVAMAFAAPAPAWAAAGDLAGVVLAAASGDNGASRALRIGSGQAAGLVKGRYGEAKVLSVKLIESKGPPVYRVKILLPGGVVKYVYVDGQSGDVFE